MNLIALRPGQTSTILELRTESALSQRLQALGFRPGKEVTMIRGAAFAGPLHVRIGTTELMLRRREALNVELEDLEFSEENLPSGQHRWRGRRGREEM